MEPIRLYAPDRYREPKLFTHIELLSPFWGVTAKESMPYVRPAALQYQYSPKDFTLVDSITDADLVVVPYSYDRLKEANPERLASIIADAKKAGKPLLIDGAGDIEHSIDIPNPFIFCVSQYRYRKQGDEITVPYPAEDLLETYRGGQLELREKQEKPSVAFAGWAGMSLKARLRTLWKELPATAAALFDSLRGAEKKDIFFREKALTVLGNTSRIEPHFAVRATYSGHVKTIQGSVADVRRQFVDNLLGADYALCVKGDENASVRFYGALSLGRIPLFLDTACVLPLEDVLTYRDFCVYVDWRDIDRIGEILADFHTKLSPDQFTEMQKKAREAYEKYLRFDAFSAQLAKRLRGYLT